MWKSSSYRFQQLIHGQSPGECERLLRGVGEHVVVVERLGCLQLLLCWFYFRLFILLGYIFNNERCVESAGISLLSWWLAEDSGLDWSICYRRTDFLKKKVT